MPGSKDEVEGGRDVEGQKALGHDGCKPEEEHGKDVKRVPHPTIKAILYQPTRAAILFF
jgi:hypothetical protein